MPQDRAVSRYIRLILNRLGTADQTIGLISSHAREPYSSLIAYTRLQSRRTHCDGLTSTEESALEWILASSVSESETMTPIAHLKPAKARVRAWRALALFAAGRTLNRPDWTHRAAAVFDELMDHRMPTGLFFVASVGDNLETTTFFELATLHAAMSYAVLVGSDRLLAIAGEIVAVHCLETQPDHATAEPWAIHAMIWNPACRPLADMMLHAHQIQQPGRATGVASLLLTDALYCLRRLNGETVA